MNAEANPASDRVGLRPGWSRPRPERIPEPTAWPVGTAFGITLMLWGLVSTLMITGVGLALFVASLAGWTREIRHERRQH